MKTQVYDSILIYYFSGTGNAKKTALWIKDEAKKIELEIKLFNIAKIDIQKIQKPTDNTLIGFISPTHGFHFPEIMRKFIKKFPKSNSCNVFVMNTRAGTRIGNKTINGLSGVLHYWSSIILNRKGYKIVGLFPIDLPSNWISIHPAISKKGTELIFKTVEPKVRQFAKEILNGKRNYKALSIYNIIQDIIISPISILYIWFGKYFFSKSFIASSDCDMCGICEKTCPVQAIKQVDSRMFWTYKCESCMKCMNNCPQKAIETAHGFIIVLWIFTSFFVGYVISQLLNFPYFENWQLLQNENIKTLIVSLAIFPFLFIGYRIMHWLMRVKIFERFFVLTSLTKYKFWGRYKIPKKIITHSNNV
jgi:ferredoxin/flavodoxin